MATKEQLVLQSKSRDFYAYTDIVIRRMTRRFVAMFQYMKGELLNIDEMEILKEVRSLYVDLDRIVRLNLLQLANEIYGEENHFSPEWLNAILRAFDPVTQYVYEYEVSRKEQRCEESIIAVLEIKGSFDTPVKRAMDLWCYMANQYADTVTDKAFIEKMRDAGVQRVQWLTADDEKVCAKCAELDGKNFRIDDVPPKPHWRCRCRLKPIYEGILQ